MSAGRKTLAAQNKILDYRRIGRRRRRRRPGRPL